MGSTHTVNVSTGSFSMYWMGFADAAVDPWLSRRAEFISTLRASRSAAWVLTILLPDAGGWDAMICNILKLNDLMTHEIFHTKPGAINNPAYQVTRLTLGTFRQLLIGLAVLSCMMIQCYATFHCDEWW